MQAEWGRLLFQVREAVTTTVVDTEELAWVDRARIGDPAAFGWLLERYRDRAVRLAAHVLRRPDEAEDVAQEAFIRAFRSLDRFRGDGRFYTWLYRIVLRVCLDRRRRAGYHDETPTYGECAARSEIDRADVHLLVESLLARLNPVMRATLVLREVEALDYEEIAAILQVPIGTVRSRLNAARAQFRLLYTAAQEETYRV